MLSGRAAAAARFGVVLAAPNEPPAEPAEPELWEDNLDVWTAYTLCQPTRVGMQGIAVGISAQECHYALALAGVRRDRALHAETLQMMWSAANPSDTTK